MKWILKSIEKQTDHRHLNFFVLHYQVDGKDYPYLIASRKDKQRVSTKEYHRPDGVSILLYKEGEKEKEILFIEEYRPGIGHTCIDFPAGLMEERDEDEFATARREAKEEGGVRVSDLSLLVPASPTSAGLSDEFVSVVMGKIEGFEDNALEEFEDIHPLFVPLSKIKGMLEDPTLVIPIHTRLACLYLLEKWK